ncbi:uncharacterized protein LY79DRAFT_584961 [Colletotrichum navitas]|uniref:Uncharacterized protein n=1 Tax=Colletotrichum navitas TaxID=681940 RepID=A0AAD8PKV3_9PEZI|nr:uncharacterized protein LY79DRAFT_584961 [Colletotrichum navitas]KAK1566171.1 hypothetical protein LY79DRAFT_584961 [Colletotrichum navitas]
MEVHLGKFELDTLEEDRLVTLKLDAVHKTARKAESDFYILQGLRASVVRFYLESADVPADSAQVLIQLTHHGDSTFCNEYDMPIRFNHENINFDFKYNACIREILMDGDLKAKVCLEHDLKLALPSPFGTWTVGISKDWNSDELYLSGITDAWFEFPGWTREFSA